MVFTRLSDADKDAFFGLLDEYFASRPDILAQTSTSDRASAGTAVQKALAANPDATANLVSAGLKHGVPKTSPYAAAASNPDITNAVGRVAAASLVFGTNAAQRANASPQPMLPRRGTSGSPAGETERPPQPPPPAPRNTSGAHGLMTTKKFGDLDTSSTRNMFASLRSSNKNAPPAAPIPSALPKAGNSFAPPPRRAVSTAAPAAPPTPPRAPSDELEYEDEEVESGEWAEALYDYSSSDAADLQLRANQRVKVVERTSDDWWTGEADGKKGQFPASYVKLL
ncbi:SH3-domain-containing protein [Rickenella mellea]|uniref:SH3-domain-containing protein n=1 Tax=Rickenella mellea TaxID=50990 RepID=A0A4R5XEZ0_9AGAM|nr:SH3-domain-containing protein [Rickenella mellea]